MKTCFLLILIFSTSLFAGPIEKAQEILDQHHEETTLNQRLNRLSAHFLGFPYGKNGPLGEGAEGKYDQDPLFRFDTFDCTTYIETIMALAISRSVPEFEVNLNMIRYKDGVVDYLKRNHFTDLQWIPLNVDNRYMEEINQTIAPSEEIKIAEAIINFPGWLKSIKLNQIIVPEASYTERLSLLDELHGEAARFSPQLARVTYISIKTLLNKPTLMEKIPDGAIVNFVRPNWDLTDVAGTHQNISHQAFLFWIKGKLYQRHASTGGKVEEVLFTDYLKRFENHPTLKGVHFMRLLR